MAESSLSMGRPDFRREIAHYLGYGRDSAGWSTSVSDELDQIINSGLRQFYNAQPVQGRAHEWTFLQPTVTVSILSSVRTYTMPDNFGGIIGPLTYDPDLSYVPVRMVPEQEIRHLAQSTVTGRPQVAAIRPMESDGTTGQRFEMVVWPTPDGDYTLSYKSKLLLSALTALNPYPYGGMAVSETILASCLAVAEKRSNDSETLWQADFQTKLLASIQRDQAAYTPDHFPYNSGSGCLRDGFYYARGRTTTVNGVQY